MLRNSAKLRIFTALFSLSLIGAGLQACSAAHSHDHTGGDDDSFETAPDNVLHISPETRAEIEAVLYERYLGGQKQGDAALLQSAFNKDAVMSRPTQKDDGSYYLHRWLDMHTVAASWAETANTDLDFKNFEILSLNAVDERMAVVLFRYNDSVYDGITLVKIEDEWQIAAKVYIKQ